MEDKVVERRWQLSRTPPVLQRFLPSELVLDVARSLRQIPADAR